MNNPSMKSMITAGNAISALLVVMISVSLFYTGMGTVRDWQNMRMQAKANQVMTDLFAIKEAMEKNLPARKAMLCNKQGMKCSHSSISASISTGNGRTAEISLLRISGQWQCTSSKNSPWAPLACRQKHLEQ